MRITVFYWIALVAVATFILLKTRIGNWIFAVGGDENAARAVGVPVAKTKIGLFMGVGLCGWLLGILCWACIGCCSGRWWRWRIGCCCWRHWL